MSWFKKTEVRRALDPETNQPIPYNGKVWLQGKMTYLGLVLVAVGAVGKLFGYDLPTTEAQGILDWSLAHWDDVAQLVGLLTSAYGRFRINK